jgi:diguanylate cyclase (GGDEF)-like protein
MNWDKRTAGGIVVGAISVAAVTWVRSALTPVAGSDMALIFYILAVLVAAAIGGGAAGIATTLLSLLAGIAFIIGPGSLATSAAEWIRVAVFAIEGVAVSLVIEQLQMRSRSLSETARELDSQRHLVERMALEDVMTGLANRRAFERDSERFLAQSLREGTPLTLVIADIDGLKRTNDTLGHDKGDALIVAVAAALRESCRASDEAYRVGGDEFAVLLPSTDRGEYDAMMVRLAGVLQEACSDSPGAGVSVGAAHAPEDGESVTDLVRVADSNMYDAKARSYEAGRPTNGST